MIITIGGLTGCGKTTLGKELSKRLGVRLISSSFKDITDRVMELQKKAEKNKDIDKEFDRRVIKEAKSGNCVVSTWLGSWLLEADFRIWLLCPFEERVRRTANREKMSLADAERYVKEKDENNIRRYLKLYGINVNNIDIFDICLNSAKYHPEHMADIVMFILREKRRSL